MWRRFAQHFAPDANDPGHKSRCIGPTCASFSWPPTSTPSSAPQQPQMSRVPPFNSRKRFSWGDLRRAGLAGGARAGSAGGVAGRERAGKAHLDATLVGPQPLLAVALRPLLLAHLQHLHRPLLKRRKAHRLLDDLAHERHALGARVLRSGHGARLAARSRPPPSSPAGRSGPRSQRRRKGRKLSMLLVFSRRKRCPSQGVGASVAHHRVSPNPRTPAENAPPPRPEKAAPPRPRQESRSRAEDGAALLERSAAQRGAAPAGARGRARAGGGWRAQRSTMSPASFCIAGPSF